MAKLRLLLIFSFCFFLAYQLPAQAKTPLTEQIIQKMIDEYGKKPFILRIIDANQSRITIVVKGKNQHFYGLASEEFVTAETILMDFRDMGITTTDDLKRFLESKPKPPPESRPTTSQKPIAKKAEPHQSTTKSSTGSSAFSYHQRFLNELRTIGIDDSVVVSVHPGFNDNIASILVTNAWHFQPYQIRLQAAQNLWKLWARIRSPSNLDLARIAIVDYNGNEVGGSRWLGGSLIWVQKR